jgi:hypothetical protein
LVSSCVELISSCWCIAVVLYNFIIGSLYCRQGLMAQKLALTWILFAPWSPVSKIVIAMERVVQFQAKRPSNVL